MNFADPTAAITSSLDGPVLVVLAVAGKPLTVSEVANRSVRGSEIGVRKSLARLVTQGIVTAIELGNARFYALNREHVAAKVALAMSDLRTDLWERTARDIERWRVRPLYASVFGSAARNEGDSLSEIDILLVRPATVPELAEAKKSKTAMEAIGMWTDAIMTRVMSQAQVKKWELNIDELRDQMRRWTGNSLQVVNLNAIEWSELRRKKSTVFQNIHRDEVRLYDELGSIVYKYSKDESQ